MGVGVDVLGVGEGGQAEVEDLELPVGEEDDVAGLEVAVYDACGGNEIACNDDASGTPCGAPASALAVATILAPSSLARDLASSIMDCARNEAWVRRYAL